MKNPIYGRRPYNMLLVRMSDLSDVVHALPAYRALQKHYPKTRFYWLVDEPYAKLLEGLPGLVEPICFDRPTLTRELKTLERFWEALRSLWLFILRLRAYLFTCAVVFQPLARASFFARGSGARVIVGKNHWAQGGWLLLNHRVSVGRKAHSIVQNMRLIEGFGVERLPERQGIVPSGAETAAMAAFLADHELEPKRFVVIHPYAFARYKCWTGEGYAALAEQLAIRHEMKIVVSFCGDEEELARAAAAAMPQGTVLYNAADLRQLATLFSSAALVVAPDTGPLHLAVAQGTPVVGLYGPTDPQRSGPFFDPHRVVRAKANCGAICRWRAKRRGDSCRCMRQLPLDPVLAACEELLGP